MEAMAQRKKQEPEKFKLRKQLAEHPFGTIRLGVASGAARVKRWFSYDQFLLKGLEKVRTEWSLITPAPNVFGAGLQPQAGAQPGELPEVDGGSSALAGAPHD